MTSVGREPLRPGVEIAPGYEILGHLSRGRRLDVYDAWSRARGCRCIVKAIRPERAGEERARDLLLREGRLLERLSHPHLVRGYETMLEPAPLIVMETLAGQTLAHMIEVDRSELSPEDVAQLGIQLGSAIRYLHNEGYLHLDLKPSNVVAEAGRARVIDLSLARPPGPAPPGVGTWCYLAPEQAAGGELGPAADVWGIGVVLYEAATGEHAFRDPDLLESETWSEPDEVEDEPASWVSDDGDGGPYPQLSERAQRVGDLRELPPGLAELIDSCLAPDPARRPAVEELLAGLERTGGIPVGERRWDRGELATPEDRRVEIRVL